MDDGTAGLATPGADSVGQDHIDAVLRAVDMAFCDIVHDRYGGGIHSVFSHGLRVKEQQLRAASGASPGYLILELHFRDVDGSAGKPTGFGRLDQRLATVIGQVRISKPPEPRAMDVRVVTEIFDEQDSGARLAASTMSDGISLQETASSVANAVGAMGIHVVRSQAAASEMGKQGRIAQRGWLPRQVRTRPNRAGGLGSNGHCRATGSSTSSPISAQLLQRLGDRLAASGPLGEALERIVVGLELGDVC